MERRPRYVVVNLQQFHNRDIVVKQFEPQSRYYSYFRANILRNRFDPIIPPATC